MTEPKNTEAPPLQAWVDESMARVQKLTKQAGKARERAQAATAERTELVGMLVEAGVPLAQIAKRAGVTRGALQWRAKA